MTKRTLTELEGVCLGLVRKHGPCTAYQVRKGLKVAPSSHWRASAGSVYPLLQRMEDEGLIVKTVDEDDGRGRQLIRITRQGRADLKRWLLAGTDSELISSMTDPVRSRLFFLDVLSVADRTAYLHDLTAEMDVYLQKTKEHLDSLSMQDDPSAYLGSLGAFRIAEARLNWLQEVARQFPEKL